MTAPKRPKDSNQRAKMIVDIATGQAEEVHKADHRNPAAVAIGKLGGLKGGKARAEKLTPEERKQIAQKAARKRWNKE